MMPDVVDRHEHLAAEKSPKRFRIRRIGRSESLVGVSPNAILPDVLSGAATVNALI